MAPGHLSSQTGCQQPNDSSFEPATSQSQERILDAPDLVDDYYLNLLDWNAQNMVSGGHQSLTLIHTNGVTRGLPKLPPQSPQITLPGPYPPPPQIAVALGRTVYLWNAGSGSVEELCTCANEADYICSVAWSADGSYLALGTSDAKVGRGRYG